MLLTIIAEIAEKTVNIPVWLFSIVVPVIIVTAGYFMTNARLTAVFGTKIDRAEKDIIELKKGKVDQNVYDILKDQLDRIERKLDEHVKDHIKS